MLNFTKKIRRLILILIRFTNPPSSACNPNNPRQKGFTLIELMVYIVIITVFLVVLTNFTINIIFIRAKSQSMQEVQQNARLVLIRMSKEMRSANDINTVNSTFGAHPGALELVMEDPLKDPTIFDIDISNDRLRIKQGGSAYQYLTGDKIKITNLVFTNLSTPDIPKAVKIQLSAESISSEPKQGENIVTNLETAVSLRKKP